MTTFHLRLDLWWTTPMKWTRKDLAEKGLLHVCMSPDATREDALNEFARLTGRSGTLTRHDGGRYTFGPETESFRLSAVNLGGWNLRWAVCKWED